MSKNIKSLIAAVFCVSVSTFVSAVPLDLSGWSALTLDYPGGQPAGNWVVAGGNTEVTQTVNADPSFYLNNTNQTSFTIDGSWQVLTSSDDDYMGFVFGYQNSSNFYLFDWKQGTQGYQGTANEGMTIKKMTGGTGDGLVDLSLAEFWENTTDLGDMEILAKNQGSGKGWDNFVLYDFNLDFNTTAGEFTINVKEGATALWDVTVSDSTFTSGQFGFYNYSQQSVRYAGFEQVGGTPPGPSPVPEPSILALLALGLIAIGCTRRKKSA